jgi:hypothetical protein
MTIRYNLIVKAWIKTLVRHRHFAMPIPLNDKHFRDIGLSGADVIALHIR